MKRTDLEAEIRRLHPDSFGWALNCCERSVPDAEDVLQTAYLKVLQGSARYDGRSAFRTWLFGVIRRTAQEHRRRRLQWQRRTGPLSDGQTASDAPDAQTRLEQTEQAQRLADALGQLTERQRDVLHLVFYQQMTVADAARIMGVSVGSARTHYARGKDRLRAILDKTVNR